RAAPWRPVSAPPRVSTAATRISTLRRRASVASGRAAEKNRKFVLRPVPGGLPPYPFSMGGRSTPSTAERKRDAPHRKNASSLRCSRQGDDDGEHHGRLGGVGLPRNPDGDVGGKKIDRPVRRV